MFRILYQTDVPAFHKIVWGCWVADGETGLFWVTCYKSANLWDVCFLCKSLMVIPLVMTWEYIFSCRLIWKKCVLPINIILGPCGFWIFDVTLKDNSQTFVLNQAPFAEQARSWSLILTFRWAHWGPWTWFAVDLDLQQIKTRVPIADECCLFFPSG